MIVSIVIPVNNESSSLKILYEELSSTFDDFGNECEIIFVNDGSIDDSLNILQEIRRKDSRVKIISLDKNYGRANALFTGFRAADGACVLTIDADLQLHTRDLRMMLEGLKNHDAVITYRTNRIQSDGFLKFISSRIANYIRNKFLNENFRDVGSSVCGYRKECLEALPLYNNEFDVFIASLLEARGCSIKEIPIQALPRRFGKSHYNMKNRALRKFMALLVVKRLKSNMAKCRKT